MATIRLSNTLPVRHSYIETPTLLAYVDRETGRNDNPGR